jgi:P-type Mg2+ transporter
MLAVPQGLSSAEAREREVQYGKHVLPKQRFRMVRLLLRQCSGMFVLLLFAAAVVTFFLGEVFDAWFILFFVFLSVLLGWYQEYKTNAAIDVLTHSLVHIAKVRRDGAFVQLPVSELVPGDVVQLVQGDIVPADCVVRSCSECFVDETTFTGESVPVHKVAAPVEQCEEATVLQGTVVVRGMVYAEVVATGVHTRLAGIARTAASIETKSTAVLDVERVGMFIVRATVVTLVCVVGANMLIDGGEASVPELLIFAIALAVSAIPEALPLVMTFSLSRAAVRLAKKDVVVKRLSAVQDVGSIEVLCTDKTGTITENALHYQNEYLIPECPWHPLVLSRLASSSAEARVPEPFDVATEAALTEDMHAQASAFTLQEEEPFDPALRSNGARVSHASEGWHMHVRRGSPECFFEQGIVAREQVDAWLTQEEQMGRRVLGVSYDTSEGARFGGFVSFADVPKESTSQTLRDAAEMGVRVVVITGDSLIVAGAVGRAVGLVRDEQQVIEAHIFFTLSHEEQRARLASVCVFARTTPEQKAAIIMLLKERYTVGFLGEGINDAAALKAAHVSLVVESASDVARETADIVLLRADLRVIVDAIRFGRETYANTQKYIRATLISNFGNLYAVAIGSLLVTFLPMLPKQLLLLNLLSDVPMMAIAFDRVHKRDIARLQRYDFKSLYVLIVTLGLVSTVFDFLWFGLFFTEGASVLQTNWFVASVITELALLFSVRSLLPIEKAGMPSVLIIAVSIIAGVVALLLPVIPITAHYFDFTAPTAAALSLILVFTLIYVATTEAVKRVVVRFLAKHGQARSGV